MGAGSWASGAAGKSGTDKWGAKAGPAAAASSTYRTDSRSRRQDDENSLVGAWDVGSSKYASSIPDSDVQSAGVIIVCRRLPRLFARLKALNRGMPTRLYAVIYWWMGRDSIDE